MNLLGKKPFPVQCCLAETHAGYHGLKAISDWIEAIPCFYMLKNNIISTYLHHLHTLQKHCSQQNSSCESMASFVELSKKQRIQLRLVRERSIKHEFPISTLLRPYGPTLFHSVCGSAMCCPLRGFACPLPVVHGGGPGQPGKSRANYMDTVTSQWRRGPCRHVHRAMSRQKNYEKSMSQQCLNNVSIVSISLTSNILEHFEALQRRLCRLCLQLLDLLGI